MYLLLHQPFSVFAQITLVKCYHRSDSDNRDKNKIKISLIAVEAVLEIS